MSVKFGTNAISKIFLGAREVVKIMRGSTPVFKSGVDIIQANLTYDLKATDIAQTNGSSVASWVCSKTGTAFSQATGGSKPSYIVPYANGHAALGFNGGQYLQGAFPVPLSKPNTIYIVCSVDAGSVILDGLVAGQGAQIYFDGTNININSSPSKAQSLPMPLSVICGVFDGANTKIYKDGVAGLSVAGNSNALTGLTFGVNPGFNVFMTGKLVHIPIYSVSHDAEDVSFNTTVLLTKYIPQLGLYEVWDVEDIEAADGDSIGAWTGRLKGLTFNQTTESKQPIYETNVANGKAGLGFRKALSTWMKCIFGDTIPHPYTLFITFSSINTEPFSLIDGINDHTHRAQIYWEANYLQHYLGGGGYVNAYPQILSVPITRLAIVANGANSKIYKNGEYVSTGNSGDNTIQGLSLGGIYADTVLPLDGHIFRVELHIGALNDAQIAVRDLIPKAKYMSETKPLLFCFGDSFTKGLDKDNPDVPLANRYPVVVKDLLGDAVEVREKGTNGDRVDQLVTKFPFYVEPYFRETRPNYVLAFVGYNNLQQGGTVAALKAEYRAYCEMITAAGGLPIAVPLPPSTYADQPPTYMANMLEFNNWLEEHYSEFAVAFVNYRNDPNIGEAANTADDVNNTYDGLHWRSARHADFAGYVKATMLALIS